MPQSSPEISALMETILKVRFTDLEQDLKCCLELQQLAEQEGDLYALTFAYVYLGDYYVAQNDTRSQKYFLLAHDCANEHNFPDLKLKTLHLMGLYYDLIFDGQTCVQYWMDALTLARELGDQLEEGILLHNLGDMFKLRSDYQESLHYLTQSLECLTPEITMDDSRYAISLLLNLAEVSLRLDQLEEMSRYLRLCETLELPPHLDDSDADVLFHRFSISVGWCAYYAACGDEHRTVSLAEECLCSPALQTADKNITFDFLTLVFEAMLRVDSASVAQRLLPLLSDLCQYGGIDAIQRYVDMQVRFSLRFGSLESQAQAHRLFYETVQENAQTERTNRAEGLRSKIFLHVAQREHERILQASRQLEQEAHLDELTGIFNRRYFRKLCSKLAIGHTDRRCGIVILDVDYFKEYNDFYGHSSGDRVLRAVAQSLQENADPRITPCRYGGDEFLALCVDMQDEEIEAYLERFRNRLHTLALPHRRSLCAQEITVSMGYCSAPVTQGWEMACQWEQADAALYRSKAKGRNCWSKA